MTLPNIVIIGAQKCGTTSLHYYLAHHPEIAMSREKELNFFTDPQRWALGLEWYAAQFSRKKVRGEASPAYSHSRGLPDVAQRMAETLPDVRILYLVRHPWQRMASSWVHAAALGRERRSFEQALAEDGTSSRLVEGSCYASLLRPFLQCFPADRIRCMTSESLTGPQRLIQLQETFRFLGVRQDFVSPAFFKVRHTSVGKRRPTALGLRLRSVPPFSWTRFFHNDLRWHAERILFRPFSKALQMPVFEPAHFPHIADLLRKEALALEELTGLHTGWEFSG
jgi:hypothetical protein